MRRYIQHLTDDLICKRDFDRVRKHLTTGLVFFNYVRNDLLVGPIQKMKPDTLGGIMCALEPGDVLASKEDLFEHLQFSGDGANLQRQLVALCLTFVICDRLDPTSELEPKFSYQR